MTKASLALCAGLLLSGCAHGKNSGPAGFSIALQVEAQGRGDASRRMLAPGEALHNQDAYALKFSVDQMSYVYVIRYSASGWSERLFPLRGDFQLGPGDWLRLPAEKKDYQLDDKTGDENIYIVASREPIDAETCKKLRLLCAKPATKPAGNDSEDPPPPPPDATPAVKSDPEIQKSGTEITARQKSDPKSEVAILRFPFQHLP